MVIKATPVKEIVLAIVAFLVVIAIGAAIFIPKASAANNPEEDVLPATTTEATTPRGEESILNQVDETQPVKNEVEETRPVETQPADTKPTETQTPKETKPDKTETGCSHVWKDEYTPETETSEGRITRECLKCGEFKVLETFPPLTKD